MSEAAAPRPNGRPSKYEERYDQEAIDFLAEGYSVAGFAGHIGVATSTVYLWQDQHQSFSEAVKIGQAKAVLWWEQRARAVAAGEDGNPTTIIFGLKNRARDEWQDVQKNELTVPAGLTVNINHQTPPPVGG